MGDLRRRQPLQVGLRQLRRRASQRDKYERFGWASVQCQDRLTIVECWRGFLTDAGRLEMESAWSEDRGLLLATCHSPTRLLGLLSPSWTVGLVMMALYTWLLGSKPTSSPSVSSLRRDSALRSHSHWRNRYISGLVKSGQEEKHPATHSLILSVVM